MVLVCLTVLVVSKISLSVAGSRLVYGREDSVTIGWVMLRKIPLNVGLTAMELSVMYGLSPKALSVVVEGPEGRVWSVVGGTTTVLVAVT
ncbi:hypothetical protein BDZ85DRAFT_264438 [Elsinoe ampelina]|uniref:Uncharacterized protein n=1 Tax=Elsinoe ampelina TaxID=302913 RepID=A0A6A6G7R9_9PEZI|nr:hypothetical protein BDZ85DRAFT_264438 [Elsinoe ampelina]